MKVIAKELKNDVGIFFLIFSNLKLNQLYDKSFFHTKKRKMLTICIDFFSILLNFMSAKLSINWIIHRCMIERRVHLTWKLVVPQITLDRERIINGENWLLKVCSSFTEMIENSLWILNLCRKLCTIFITF